MIILKLILLLTLTISFSFSTHKDNETEQKISNGSNIETISQSEIKTTKDSIEIPPDGKYRYDIAFAEWNGISMGEKVTVIIKGDSVKVIYEGDGQLTLTEPGEIIDEGILRKHRTGKWIITASESDTEIDEIGGCTGGPSVIDFENKKYWMC